MRRLNILFFLLTIYSCANAKFAFNSNCIKAYDHILSMRFNDGQALLNIEKKTNPSNSIILLLEDYIEFLTVLSDESKESFEKYKINKSRRIDLLQKEDKSSPYYDYCMAEINLHSCINRIKFQEFVSGGYELQKAYKLLEENQRNFPNFLPNQKSFGLLYSLVGLVPESYKWALSTVGLKGNVQEGIRILTSLKEKLPKSEYAQFHDETVFFLNFILMNVENADNVYERIIKNTEGISNDNMLNVYTRSLAALRTGHTDDAITFLTQRPRSAAYAPFHYLDYITGLAKLNRFDADANEYFERYLKNYNGTFNVKDSYLKLAWYYLLRGDTQKYNSYLAACRIRGAAVSEKDKEALNQSKNNYVPNIPLLKSRLYFDGGYYEKALAVIKDKKPEQLSAMKEKLELTYRLGRIYYALKKYDVSIQYFTTTISSGIKEPYYYSANSALFLGYIFEERKQVDKAKYYYTLSMKMDNDEYKASIETKAKAGLKRISRQ